MKLLIAGSHAGSTAYSLVEEIKRQNLNWDIVFVGRKFANEGKKQFSLEYKYLPKLGVKFLNLDSGKLQTKFTRYTLLGLAKLPIAFIYSAKVLQLQKPDIVLCLGGATGAIISFWAFVMRIPLIVHEQTAAAGRANLFSAIFADKVCISRDTSNIFFDSKKIVLTGNPLVSDLSGLISRPSSTVKSILVTGGSRGSKWINDALLPLLSSLTRKYKVIHQTGQEDYHRFKDLKLKNYQAFQTLEPKDFIKKMSESDIIISRAGANTVSEIIYLRKLSVLIPIPWVYKNEQMLNAQLAQKLGLARILEQEKLSPLTLKHEIEYIDENFQSMNKKVKTVVSPDIDASLKVTNVIKQVYEEKSKQEIAIL